MANVTATGLFSVDTVLLIGNNTTATATYTLGPSVRSNDFTINTSLLIVLTGTLDGPSVDFTAPIITSPRGYDAGFVGAVVTQSRNFNYLDESDLTFALESPVASESN